MVRFENVGLRYGLGPEVLRDLSFQIEPQSFQFLTGPSGAGKTSLLRLLFLSLRPTRGLITVFDHDIATLSKDSLATLRRRIGIVFQDFRLLDHMTTYENVALPFRVMGKDEESYRDEVVELLHWVGLGDRMGALPPVLSGGEKQRAAIARAVIARPQLLLADEPTGNVDPNLAQRLLRLFIELNKSGTTVVIATHDISLMDQYDCPPPRAARRPAACLRLSDDHDRASHRPAHGQRADDAAGDGGLHAARRHADRAEALDRRPRAGGGGRHHDVPRFADHRRGHAGAVARRSNGNPTSRARSPSRCARCRAATSRPRSRAPSRSPAPFPASARCGPIPRRSRRACSSRGSAAGLSLDDLPVPRMIVVKLADRRRRSRAAAQGAGRAGRRRQPRRSSRLDRPDARHGADHDRRRHRRAAS